jgi:signal transduction histidine kinase
MRTERKPDHFKFSTAILSRLGEELNPHPDQGIIELVRNAYDADAHTCAVQLKNINKKGGSIQVIDDGEGMDLSDISDGWLVLGRSTKDRRRRTWLGRLPIGDKGLGRLAALRMGRKATLVTRPREQPLFEHRLVIDWDEYDRAKVVEDVTLFIETTASRTSGKFGTEILVEDLNFAFTKADIERLARALILLADPFGESSGFSPVLDTPEFRDLATIMRGGYFTSSEFHLTGKINDAGMGEAQVYDWQGKLLWSADHVTLRGKKKPPYDAPATTFSFYAFNLGKTEFLARSVQMADLRAWLRAVGGVHFYHRGLRVYPYGDQGHDWLDMNLRRSQTQELRPSTNNSIGKIWADDPDNRLRPKTDRSAFIENTAFQEIKSFAQDALEWLADCRLKRREERRAKSRVTASTSYRQAKAELNKALECVPEVSRELIRSSVDSFESSAAKRVEVLEDELQLYRTLSTVGTTFAAFAHEFRHPLDDIKTMANEIRATIDDVKNTDSPDFASTVGTKLQRPFKIITNALDALIVLPTVALQLLEHEKRRPTIIHVNDDILEFVKIIRPLLHEQSITPAHDLVRPAPCIYATKASFQSILINLVTNAVHAFARPTSEKRKRTIMFRTSLVGRCVRIHVMDNGPGIVDLGIEEIWLPGKTTTPQGTGLGLTIVRDTVTDLGGTVQAIAKGELGGAEIVFELPTTEVEQ